MPDPNESPFHSFTLIAAKINHIVESERIRPEDRNRKH